MHVQGQLVNDMRYLASVVTQCFSAFGELLALNKRFAELSGGVTRCACMHACTQRLVHEHLDAADTTFTPLAPDFLGRLGSRTCRLPLQSCMPSRADAVLLCVPMVGCDPGLATFEPSGRTGSGGPACIWQVIQWSPQMST